MKEKIEALIIAYKRDKEHYEKAVSKYSYDIDDVRVELLDDIIDDLERVINQNNSNGKV